MRNAYIYAGADVPGKSTGTYRWPIPGAATFQARGGGVSDGEGVTPRDGVRLVIAGGEVVSCGDGVRVRLAVVDIEDGAGVGECGDLSTGPAQPANRARIVSAIFKVIALL
jgi:hypothetical protein